MSLEDRPPLEPAPAPPPPPPVQRRPWVCWAITALCIGVYLWEAWLSGDINAPDTLGEQSAPAVLAGEWWRLATSVFEHRNLLHLGFNLTVVLQLGAKLERALGPTWFLAVSAACALGSGLAELLFAAGGVGASGMILGWAGALFPIGTGEFRRWLIFWLGPIAISSVLPFVSWQGHLGGFAAGLLCGLALRLSGRRA